MLVRIENISFAFRKGKLMKKKSKVMVFLVMTIAIALYGVLSSDQIVKSAFADDPYYGMCYYCDPSSGCTIYEGAGGAFCTMRNGECTLRKLCLPKN